jgi:hypothetical protein
VAEEAISPRSDRQTITDASVIERDRDVVHGLMAAES